MRRHFISIRGARPDFRKTAARPTLVNLGKRERQILLNIRKTGKASMQATMRAAIKAFNRLPKREQTRLLAAEQPNG